MRQLRAESRIYWPVQSVQCATGPQLPRQNMHIDCLAINKETGCCPLLFILCLAELGRVYQPVELEDAVLPQPWQHKEAQQPPTLEWCQSATPQFWAAEDQQPHSTMHHNDHRHLRMHPGGWAICVCWILNSEDPPCWPPCEIIVDMSLKCRWGGRRGLIKAAVKG